WMAHSRLFPPSTWISPWIGSLKDGSLKRVLQFGSGQALRARRSYCSGWHSRLQPPVILLPLTGLVARYSAGARSWSSPPKTPSSTFLCGLAALLAPCFPTTPSRREQLVAAFTS